MKPPGSIERVEQAAAAADLAIEIRRMGASTRTAEEAAQQCGCTVGQIVKSLVFQGNDSGRLYLFLVSLATATLTTREVTRSGTAVELAVAPEPRTSA